jgi:hypothetical protein
MRKIIFLLFGFCTAAGASAQNSSLKGAVADTIERRNLSNASVSLLKKSDSILVKFTRADKNGSFSIPSISPGSYILMNTHPFMGDYFDNIELKAGEALDLGTIYLTPKTKLLEAVIVKTGSPIRIKGDTIVYTADSFKVRAGANVEELLRRLPGISVDKDGKITAMGERVTKVLVDGEEFFGTDPGIATKNIRADAVQEVQVFDKKSDQAAFTGIDDGVKDKTINLKMKKSAGYFGKIEAGGGLKDKYNNSAMINLFENKRKIAGYGIMSNTGQTNLDWEDAQNYGGSNDNMLSGINDDGAMWIAISNDDNFYGGRGGIPQNWNGGLHYSNKFNKEKTSFNSGYKFSKVNAPGITETFSETFLPDTTWRSRSRRDNFSSVSKHSANLTLDFNLDSNNSLKWTSRFNKNSTRSDNSFYSETTDVQNRFINNSTRTSNNRTERDNITSNLLWRHKFRKLSRTLSINADFNHTASNSDGLLYSLNNYYKNGLIDNRDTTDQLNLIGNIHNSLSAKIAYTEPVKKDFYLELSYAIIYTNAKNDRLINKKSSNGKYEEPIDSLSNFFIFNQLINTPGLNFRLNKKKYNVSFGSSVAFSHFKQNNRTANSLSSYNFINFLPRVTYNYKFKPNESIRISYNGSNMAPTPEQLQPTRVNTDPLNLYIGNPDLKQSFRHDINAGYNFYNVLKERGFWSSLNFSATDNAFVQSSRIDYTTGKRTYQTINTDGVYTLNFYSQYNFSIKNTQLKAGVGPIINLYKNIEFINNEKNITQRNNFGLSTSIRQYVAEKFSFGINNEFAINKSTATVNAAANAEYWSLETYIDGSINITKKMILESSLNAQYRQKDPRFPTRNNFSRWNASLTQRMLKDNTLELKLSVLDLLNQNRGYDRNFSSYSFTETYYNTLRRFWLLSLTWNFSKNGKPTKLF